MTPDVHLRREGRVGRVTVSRPEALNALTHDMVIRIDAALVAWAQDDDVALVVIEGASDRAFCAGGDLPSMYEVGRSGDTGAALQFWRDEYRLDRRLARYPKPVVSFLHGITMGGGVGLGCHASHRVVDDTSRIAMPECAVGLIPDVGGSLLLARAPGRLGVFLGLTGHRMGPGDAILCGFADHYVPDAWDELKAELIASGDCACVREATAPPPEARLEPLVGAFDGVFEADELRYVDFDEVPDLDGALRRALASHAPLSLCATYAVQHRLDPTSTIEDALEMEWRFCARAFSHGDFLEGIRAMIVDKDRRPRWRHADVGAVTPVEIDAVLAPVDAAPLSWS